jgi:hypothetical protein
MAAGVAFQVGPSSIADGSYLDIVPASGEAVVHNIYVPTGTSVEYYFYDGANSIKFDTDTQGKENVQYHITTTKYLRVKNVSGSAAYFAADGMGTA